MGRVMALIDPPIPARRPKLSALVVSGIRRRLAEGALRPGGKLPSEQQLTTEFGVSRTVIREALAVLAADGLVEARQGAGVFATRPFRSDIGALTGEMGNRVSSALNVLEVRLAIEVESAALAARRHGPSQEAEIQEAFFEFDRLLKIDAPTGMADFAFHRAIAAATGNPFYIDVLDALGRKTIPCDVTLPESTEAVQDRAYQARLQREHLAILDAISARDPDAARTAMRRHLTNSQKRYRSRLRDRQAHYAASITPQRTSR